jgi:hypothetical protein
MFIFTTPYGSASRISSVDPAPPWKTRSNGLSLPYLAPTASWISQKRVARGEEPLFQSPMCDGSTAAGVQGLGGRSRRIPARRPVGRPVRHAVAAGRTRTSRRGRPNTCTDVGRRLGHLLRPRDGARAPGSRGRRCRGHRGARASAASTEAAALDDPRVQVENPMPGGWEVRGRRWGIRATNAGDVQTKVNSRSASKREIGVLYAFAGSG